MDGRGFVAHSDDQPRQNRPAVLGEITAQQSAGISVITLLLDTAKGVLFAFGAHFTKLRRARGAKPRENRLAIFDELDRESEITL